MQVMLGNHPIPKQEIWSQRRCDQVEDHHVRMHMRLERWKKRWAQADVLSCHPAQNLLRQCVEFALDVLIVSTVTCTFAVLTRFPSVAPFLLAADNLSVTKSLGITLSGT